MFVVKAGVANLVVVYLVMVFLPNLFCGMELMVLTKKAQLFVEAMEFFHLIWDSLLGSVEVQTT